MECFFSAKRLYCPKVKNKPCGCVQNFINGDGMYTCVIKKIEAFLHANHILNLPVHIIVYTILDVNKLFE